MSSGTDSPRERHGRRIAATLASTLLVCALALVSPGLTHGATVSDPLEARLAASPTGTTPVMVTFRDQVDEGAYRGRPSELVAALRERAHRTRAREQGAVHGKGRWFWLVNGVALDATPAEIAALGVDPDVASVDLDPEVTIAGARSGVTPDDSWGVPATGAPAVWRRYGLTGAGVRVGSIDTGADATNPELAGAIVAWRDFINDRPVPYDDNGHGTHTVGTMVARNLGATVGVAPGAQAVVAKAIRADGTAMGSDLLAAAEWMTDPDGDPATPDFPAVINNSWTAPDAANEWFRPMVQAWVALGIVPVFGAGNSGTTIGNPASYPESFTAGSVDESGAVSETSSRGLLTWNVGDVPTAFSKPDVTAPGVYISSTVPGGYGMYSGSSMAAPHLAGAVALVKQARPDMGPGEIRALITATATDRGTPGADLDSGAGTINVLAAVAATGLPEIVAPAASVATATPRRVTVRVLRVTRRHGYLVIRGRITGHARMRVAIRRSGSRTANSLTRAQTKTVAVRAGGFTFRIPTSRLKRGRYVLVVTASDKAGQRLGSATRGVRLR